MKHRVIPFKFNVGDWVLFTPSGGLPYFVTILMRDGYLHASKDEVNARYIVGSGFSQPTWGVIEDRLRYPSELEELLYG